MSTKKTPLQIVKEEFGGKDKLVDKVMGLIDRGEEEAGQLKERLLAVSNKKLIRLAKVGEKVKTKYGSTDKLVSTVAGALSKAKDADYMKKLAAYRPTRLLDIAESIARRAAAGAHKGTEAAKQAAAMAAPVAAKATTAAKGVAKKAAAAAKSAAPKAGGAKATTAAKAGAQAQTREKTTAAKSKSGKSKE